MAGRYPQTGRMDPVLALAGAARRRITDPAGVGHRAAAR